MPVAVGIDVAKQIHWVEIKVAETGQVLTSHPVGNTPPAIGELIEAIRAAELEHGRARVGLDLLEAMLLEAGLRVLHVPGVTVSEARRGTKGGEQKSDPKDARVIADQLRMHDDFRELATMREDDVELWLLVGRRGEIVADQTRRAARLRELLASIHPQLEATVDVTSKIGLWLLTRYVTPAEIRGAGRRRIITHLGKLKNIKNTIITTITEAATSKAYYARKRAEGKNHQQAVIALARRRINVLHAIMRTRQPYDHRNRPAA